MSGAFEHIESHQSGLAKRTGLLALAVSLLAIAVRSHLLAHGSSFHPDERHIVMTVMRMSWEDLNPHTFAYGSFPFYLMFFISKLLGSWSPELVSYDGMFLVGRAISVAFGGLGVLLTYILGRKLTGSAWVGVGAAALLALNPFHIQLSRFATVDGMLTTLNLAALLGCLWVVDGKRPRLAAAITGLFIGISFATKISSLSLLLPATLALCFAPWGQAFYKARGFWISLVSLLLIAVMVGIAAQPYALLDSKTFLAHTTEQVNMVRGEWRPPYTIQYENTTPYLYHIGQMCLYTVGIPVMLSMLAGLLFVGRGLFSPEKRGWLIALAWALAVFLIVARYQVKFPRYLLPLYSIVMVLAAEGLRRVYRDAAQRLGSQWGLVPIGIVGALSVFSAVSFVQIYKTEHVYVQASRWIFENIPKGSKILGVHWDDKLPLHLPGYSPHEYGYSYEGENFELPVYEPESPRKLSNVTARLAASDYIVLPTARTYASIARVPEEFPATMQMFQLLFAERLGYSLVASIKVYPSLLGRSVNDDLADESFSVYDHPKVVVFKNEERLSAAELTARIQNAEQSVDLPSREAMMLVNAGTKAEVLSPGPVDGAEQFGAVVLWYLVLQVLSLLVVPLLAWVFPKAPDGGYAFSKSLGLMTFAFVMWLLGTYAEFPITGATLWVVLSLLAALSLQAAFRRRDAVAEYFSRYGPVIVTVEGLFGAGFLFVLFLRLCSPEIFWGEKPMDFSFLNYFIRLSEFPIDDPWFYVHGDRGGMNYYYLGFFAYALMHKLTGIASGVGFNLALCSVGGAALVAGFGSLLWILGSRRAALFGSLIVVLISNLEVLYLGWVQGKAFNFDLFWASSRGLTSPAISEYPIWSFLFADLHPHVMALPVGLTLIGLAAAPLVGIVPKERMIVGAGIVGALLGMLLGLNSWDVMVLGILVAVMALVWLWHGVLSSPVSERRDFLIGWCSSLAAFSLFGALAFTSIASVAQSSVKLSVGYVWANEFNSVGAVVRHFGIYLLPAMLTGAALIARRWRYTTHWHVALGAAFGILASAILWGVSVAHGVESQPWGVFALCAVSAALGGALVAAGWEIPRLVVGGVFLLLGSLVIWFAELFFIMDRMNTIFKLYYPLWGVLGVAAVVLVYEYLFAVYAPRRALIPRMVGLAVLVVGALGVVGSGYNIWVMTRFHRIDGPRPTLDGTAYLEQRDGDEARVLRWLSRNISGVVPVVEAWGSSYGEFTRVTMFTGLPTVLGWDYHVQQRGAPRSEIEKRKSELRAFYQGADPEKAKSFLQRYGWPLVVVGNVERRAYQNIDGVKRVLPDLGYRLLVEFGPVAVWGPQK